MSNDSQLVERAPLAEPPTGLPTAALPAPSGHAVVAPMPPPVGLAQLMAAPSLPVLPLSSPPQPALSQPASDQPTPALPMLAGPGQPAPDQPAPALPMLAAPLLDAPGPAPLMPQLPNLPATMPPPVVDGHGAVPVVAPAVRAARPTRGPSRRALVFGVLSAFLVAGVVYFTVIAQTTPDDVPVPPATTLPIVPATPVLSPLLEPIEDSRELVEQINSNDDAVNELLTEAGIETSDGVAHVAYFCTVGVGVRAVPGYEFTTRDMNGTVRHVIVDAESGDFSIDTLGGGVAYRSLEGQTFVRATAAEEWVPVVRSKIDSVLGFGLVGLVSEASIVPNELLPYATLVSDDMVDGRRTTIHDLDIDRLRAEEPSVMAAWMGHLGVDASRVGVEGAAPLRIAASLGDDGILHGFEIADSATGESVSYTVEAIFETPPTINL